MKNKNIPAVQNLIRCLPLDSLKNPEVVANLVRAFGIVAWGPRTIGPEVRFINPDNAGIAQTPDQIAKCLVYLSQFKINSFCEIGIYFGANLLFCSEYLRRFNPDIKCLGVDPTGFLDSDIKELIDKEIWITLKPMTSEDLKGEKFDYVFIDGDHVQPWVQMDWQNLGQHAKICGFHDLQDPGWPDVAQYWNTLKGNKDKVMVEFLDDLSNMKTHGIGIIHNKDIEDKPTITKKGKAAE
jgi:hypothetical protein